MTNNKYVLDNVSNSSGKNETSILTISPFSFGHRIYSEEDPFNYGNFSVGGICYIFYRFIKFGEGEGKEMNRIVAAFVSKFFSDISILFHDSDYVSRVAIDLKKSLNEYQYYLNSYNVEYKPKDKRINYGQDVYNDLEDTIEHLKNLIEDGWTDVIVATAGRKYDYKQGFLDFLDLNTDYFLTILPQNSFPFMIGDDIIVPNVFISNRFPPGKIIHSESGGYRFQNLFEYKLDSNDYPMDKLKITFDRATFDIYKESTNEVGKLRGGKAPITNANNIIEPLSKLKWPTLKQITDQISQELSNAGANEKGEKIRRKAIKDAERLFRRAKKASENNKKEIAEKYENAANELLQKVRKNCVAIQPDYNKKIQKANPLNHELEKATNEALNNLKNIDLLPGGGGDDVPSADVFDPIREQFTVRLGSQTEDLKKTKITSPEYRKKINKIVETIVNIEITTTNNNPTNYNKFVESIVEPSIKYIKEQIEKIVQGHEGEEQILLRQKYVIQKIKAVHLAYALGDISSQLEVEQKLQEIQELIIHQICNIARSYQSQSHVLTALWLIKDSFIPPIILDNTTISLIREKNMVIENKTYTDKLDSILKGLIKVRVIVLRKPLPFELMKNIEIKNYVNKLKKMQGVVLEGEESTVKNSYLESIEPVPQK